MAFARDKQTKPFVEQWARTGRWFERLKSAYALSDKAAPPDELMDLFYAVLQNCYMMRDWLIHSGVDRQQVEALFKSEKLRLCRDIANGTKHCRLERPSVDPNFATLAECDPNLKSVRSSRTVVVRLVAAGKKYDLFGLVGVCMCEIQGFLIQRKLVFEESKLLV